MMYLHEKHQKKIGKFMDHKKIYCTNEMPENIKITWHLFSFVARWCFSNCCFLLKRLPNKLIDVFDF